MDPEDALPFLFTAIIVGTALVQLATLPRFSWLQQTVMLFILGMLYSAIVDLSELKKHTHGFFGVSHHMWMNISPHLLLAVMLPILITGDSISVDTSVAKQVAKQCAYLAGPGVVICALCLALFFWFYIPYEWPFMLCLTMSSILAATDPVAVVSLLKELGASPALTVQIQGESLLNDGTAMVLFTVAYEILSGLEYSFGDVIIFLVKSTVGAVLLGFAIGGISVGWIRFASNRLDDRSNLIQISITLCCAYWSWIVAEGTFHVSGILCTVSSALVLADQMWPSIVSKEAMHHVWHTFEHIGNSTIFFVAGSLTGHNMVDIPFMDYVHLIVIYLVCTIVRGGMLLASVPILNAVKHSCTEPVSVADATVMCWGGLRGALGLALAIKVNVDCAGDRISSMDGQRVLFYVGGVALLTLIVNATTCPALVKRLQLNRPNGTKQMMMLNIHRQMSDFACEQAKSTTAISNHIESMLSEVERSINKAVDQSTVDSVERISVGPTHIASNPSRDTYRDLSLDRSPSSDGLMGYDSFDSLWCCRRVRRRALSMPTSATLVKRLTAARHRLLSAPPVSLDMLGLSPLAEGEETEQLLELLELDGDWATSMQLKPINDVFLSLVRAKYWASIEADEFVQGEGQCLLDSISGALGISGFKLFDLYYIRRQLLKLFREDLEARRAILMEKPEEEHKDSFLFGEGDGSVEMESVEGEQAKGCLRVVSSVWYNSVMIVVIIGTACICIAITLLSTPSAYIPPAPGEYATVHLIFTFYLVDFIVRLCAYKSEMCQSGWRQLDAFLTVLCFIGNLLQALVRANAINDHILGAPFPEVIRALMVLQLLRVHQLFKSVRTIRTLRRLATGSMPKHLGGRLQAVAILTALTRAHKQSQEDLIKYFGRRGKVGSGVVARCIVESLTEVCDASYMAWRVSALISPAVLNSLRTLRTCVLVTEDLCKLVEDAHRCGAMSEQDADSVLHPLKSHQYALRAMVHNAHEGVLPADLMVESPQKRMEEKADQSQVHTVGTEGSYELVGPEYKCSSWAKAIDSTPSGLKHEPAAGLDSPRSLADAATQTESPAPDAAAAAWAAGAASPEADYPVMMHGTKSFDELEVLEHKSREADELQMTPAPSSAPEGAVAAVASRGKEMDKDVDLSQCETWSVYTVDDLTPPQHPPGPGAEGSRLDPRLAGVRL